jgi:GNAT superfamily N-acetyltransferase
MVPSAPLGISESARRTSSDSATASASQQLAYPAPLVSVRPATTDDIPALMPLMRGYCDFYGAHPPDEGLVEMARALIRVPDEEGILLVAADDGGKLAGFVAAGWKWSSLKAARVAVMEDLFVDPGARGGGLGLELIRACADRAHELGAAALEWVTATDNERAQSVYARVGGEGDVWMIYELGLGSDDAA